MAYVSALGLIGESSWGSLRPPPAAGTPFEHKISYTCKNVNFSCAVYQVNLNGIHLRKITPGLDVSSEPYFLAENNTLTIVIPKYTSIWEGMFQGIFEANSKRYISKNLVEIGPEENLEGEIIFVSAVSNPNEYAMLEDLDDTMWTHRSLNPPDPEAELKSEAEGEPPADGRRKHQPPGTRRSEEKMEQSCTVHILRDSVQAGHAYKQKIVEYTCPGGQLVAVSCRGQNVTTGLSISTNHTVSIDFDHFEDINACVYTGIFKINQTEHRKTLAVLEMIDVTMSAVESPPPSGEFKHKVVYTCNVAKCDPAMIYINDKTLKSDDKNSFYSYKSEKVKGIMTVTIHFSIKPFTKEYEGVYQLVVTNGTERVTKNIMEIGALV